MFRPWNWSHKSHTAGVPGAPEVGAMGWSEAGLMLLTEANAL
jgi:hypothetical protein